MNMRVEETHQMDVAVKVRVWGREEEKETETEGKTAREKKA